MIRVKRIGRYDYISIFNCSATTMMVVYFLQLIKLVLNRSYFYDKIPTNSNCDENIDCDYLAVLLYLNLGRTYGKVNFSPLV